MKMAVINNYSSTSQYLAYVLICVLTVALGCQKIDTIKHPSLTTVEVTEITKNSAKSGGNITADGGATVTSRGVVWSNSENPTIENNDGITEEGEGMGVFTSELTELSPGTQYFVRAYSTNSVGTSYGNQIEFITKALFSIGGGVTDIDGNEYETVIIGKQEWMAENLRVTKYSNGESIRTGLNDYDWYYSVASEGAYAIYPHHKIEGLSSEAEVVEAYGILYNLNAVSDERGLCPAGWHVPGDDEWMELEVFLGMSETEVHESAFRGTNEGKMLKSSRTAPDPHPRWFPDDNNEGNNKSGFSGLPGGMRQRDYHAVGVWSYWWTSTWDTQNHGGWFRQLCYKNKRTFRSTMGKEHGLSVRCVRYYE